MAQLFSLGHVATLNTNNMNTPKIKGINVLISWLIFTLATTFWRIAFVYILDVTGASKDQGTKNQHALVLFAVYSVSLIVTYFIYSFVVVRFILPKISVQNDSAPSTPVA